MIIFANIEQISTGELKQLKEAIEKEMSKRRPLLTPEQRAMIKGLIDSSMMIGAIKQIREFAPGTSLLDAKLLAEAIRDNKDDR